MATISSMPFGTLIRAADSDGGNGTANYELVDLNNLVSGGAVLVRKDLYGTSAFGSTVSYPNGTIDNLVKSTIYNKMPQKLRDIMMDTTFTLYADGSITRKMFIPTYTMVGFGTNSGTTEGKALQYYTSNDRRIKKNNGSTTVWWLASRRDSSYAWCVGAGGSSGINYPSGAYGVAPAFTIPQSTQLADTANSDGSYNIKYTEKITCTINLGSTSDMPQQALPIISCNGNLTLKICNNANDSSPTWETATNETVQTFTNTAKTATQWAIGLNINITRTASEALFLNEPVVLTMN